MRFEKRKIVKFLADTTDCDWGGDAKGNLVIDNLNNTPRATVQRVVNAYHGQMRTQDLGDGIKVLVISRRKK